MIARLAILMTLVALPAFADSTEPTPAPRPVASVIASAEPGRASGYAGTVVARAETDLAFPMAGTVAERLVDTGDVLAQGDIVARLDPEDLEADLRTARAGVAVAQAQLRSATDARERASTLADRGVDSTTRLEDAERALTAAQARLEQARATEARATDMLNHATLRAPQDGVVTTAPVDSGATVTAGQAIVQLAGTDAREVVIDVTEQDAAGMVPGTQFRATLAADPNITATARLTRVEPVAASATRTRRVHLTLMEPPDAFRLGALARVTATSTTQAALSLPASAILAPDTDPAVWVVTPEGRAVRRTPVTLGARLGDRLQITSGITPGEEIVAKGINSLKDGQIVGPRVQQ
ncbi:efflux RND transporter periplasmic adaptor subunit [Arenibacterium halophilum]|uniref:Efflux RND transporter periplasmic adaptor subunit n=1 Tax=Arenibacterium halophilum TaxID=2583821 RepID=A0ABY2XFJ3_9RHOB|nr:efflux RND transporter periplasmic adaptor subunit [Arenibacterium halophilum]TMV15377.1 efflux RND transporter periplasmic adaptor subunit [Arenibacterium halophilum]